MICICLIIFFLCNLMDLSGFMTTISNLVFYAKKFAVLWPLFKTCFCLLIIML
jgi:hypothetical protein